MDSGRRPTGVAPFRSRWLAAGIDAGLLLLVGLILGLGLGSHLGGPGGTGRLLGFPIAVAYFGLAGSRLGGGQTAGKTFVGLRVVGPDGEPLGVGRALLRASVLTAPWFFNNVQFRYDMPLALPLAMLACALIFGMVPASIALFVLSGGRQFLHDVVARSFVVVGNERPLSSGPPRWALAASLAWIVTVTVWGVAHAPLGPKREDDPLLSALRRVPRVASASVTPMEVSRFGGQHYRALYVTVTTGLGGDEPEKVVRRSAAAVVAFYPQLNEFQAIRVENRAGFDVGLASWSTATVEMRTPGEWRALVEPEADALLSGRVR